MTAIVTGLCVLCELPTVTPSLLRKLLLLSCLFSLEIHPRCEDKGLLTEVQPEAEETVEHRANNKTYFKEIKALRQMINAWFGVRIRKQATKETVE